MTGITPPSAATVGQVQYQPSTAAATMECLCQLQDQGGYQTLAGAIVAGDMERALRSYKTLSRRAPRPTQRADDTPDALEQTFARLGQALDEGNEAGARQAMDALQQAVQYAHAHHRHGDAAVAAPDPSPAHAPDDGHIDVKV